MWVSYDSDSSINYKSFATVKKTNLQTNVMEIYLANILLTFQDEKPQDFEGRLGLLWDQYSGEWNFIEYSDFVI